MSDRFVSFLLCARWASAIVALTCHLRFLLFVNHDALQASNILLTGFYFLTGLGHESYAVFFILDGILVGLILFGRRSTAVVDRAALSRHAGSLYRILLPSLLVGASLDLTGTQVFSRTGVYTSYPEFSELSLSYSSLLGNLLMLQAFFVPTFGSNSMLYLPAYLFWCLVLLLLFARAGRLDKPRRPYVRILLVAAVALVMPFQFLVWAAIWLTGIAVVYLGQSRAFRPPLWLTAPCFAAMLVLSRLMVSNAAMLPERFVPVLVEGGFWLVGASFAGLAWSLYPQQNRLETLAPCASRSAEGWAGQTASFTFYCHFPVIMLLAAMGAALLEQPLMRQPTPASSAWFACLALACIGTAAIVMRAATAAARAMADKGGPRA